MFTKVGKIKAWVLWDSESTNTNITPSYAQVAEIPISQLSKEYILQLGTVGSRSTVKFGTYLNPDLPECVKPIYVDVANFDYYDMIIGTPTMLANKVLLDFDKSQVIFNGIAIPAVEVDLSDTDDIPDLWQNWYNNYQDIVNGTPDKLLPFQDVNHEIHLIDESKQYKYHFPKCPNSLHSQFHEKCEQY
ncbi:hypothetical protein BDQ17DRAFT_1254531 [Cyathus striatus]|nr:hypothetical protein BDQ17DRAFT_1254531 [Cyathus striatus]